MSILINKDTKVITQGITGKTGQFHTRGCRDYANGKNAFVAGVNPKKAGSDVDGIPVFATVAEAMAASAGRDIEPIQPHVVARDDALVLVLPGDPDYVRPPVK
jgi:succinyl-CoA synthetase alpha subunit